MKFQYMHPRDQLVEIMNRIYYNGMTTLSGGNLSIQEDNGDLWITPTGIDKGNLRPEDINCIHADGSVSGPHKPSSEFPFHKAIYAARSDLKAVVHAHPPALVSFSIVRQTPDTRIIPQANRVCGRVGYAPYALPGSEELGANIAQTFAQGYHVVILENHGVAAGGENLLEAFQRLETLDFCARTLLNAHGMGSVKVLSEAQLRLFDTRAASLPEFNSPRPSSLERELRKQLVEIVHRACQRYLMISTEGVASVRLPGSDFLITPTGMDRQSLAAEDIVLVSDGKREAGKQPSRSVKLHQAIYQRQPAIQCIITAQSPHVAAYALTSEKFDTKTIPESYILLLEVPTLPFELLYQQPEVVAERVSLRAPVQIIQNDCILVVGESILKTFDRLEVAEYSAKALLDSAAIGKLAPIGPEDVIRLQEKFQVGP